MKKLAAFVLSIVLVLTLTGCSAEEKEHTANTFPLTQGDINQILTDNGLPFAVQSFTEMPATEDYGQYYNHNYVLCDITDEAYGQASVQFLFGDIGNRVRFTYLVSIPGTSPAHRYIEKEDAVQKAVAVACDLYGGFENKDKLAEKIDNAIAKDDLRHYEDGIVWYEKFENTHILVNVMQDTNSTEKGLKLYSIQIHDDTCFKIMLETSGRVWAKEIYNEVYS